MYLKFPSMKRIVNIKLNNFLVATLGILLCAQICGQNIDQNRLAEILKKAEQTHSESIIIYQNNKLVTEKYFGIGHSKKKIETMSCTKSIVGLAIACLLTDKLVDSLDVPVCKYYPEWNQGRKKMITLRHLVNMTSGLQNVPDASKEIYPSKDFVQLALCAELSDAPGEVFSYNNKSLNLLAGLIKKITGKRMDKYISERLFEPLGIKDYNWSLDSVGNPHVMAGCQIVPADFAKIGLLLLNKGLFNGQQIIAENMVKEIVTPARQTPFYGILWWIDYENIVSIIDDDIVRALEKAELPKDFIDKVIAIKGKYGSSEEYISVLQKTFGENPWDYLNNILAPKNLQIRKKLPEGRITYRADGYLGNYIIVDPITKIVAIRMISADSYKGQTDGFSDFKKLITMTK